MILIYFLAVILKFIMIDLPRGPERGARQESIVNRGQFDILKEKYAKRIRDCVMNPKGTVKMLGKDTPDTLPFNHASRIVTRLFDPEAEGKEFDPIMEYAEVSGISPDAIDADEERQILKALKDTGLEYALKQEIEFLKPSSSN